MKGRFQCIELAKTPRPPPTNKGKSKDKGKSGAKAADKGKNAESSVVYDYHDGSVHDFALRAQILRGYEEFKVCGGIALRARSWLTIASSSPTDPSRLSLRHWASKHWSCSSRGSSRYGRGNGTSRRIRSLATVLVRLPTVPFALSAEIIGH